MTNAVGFKFLIETRLMDCLVVSGSVANRTWENVQEFDELPDFCIAEEIDGNQVDLFYVKLLPSNQKKKHLSWKTVETILNTLTKQISERVIKALFEVSTIGVALAPALTDMQDRVKAQLKQTLHRLTDQQYAKNVIGYSPRNPRCPTTISAFLATNVQYLASTRVTTPSKYVATSKVTFMGHVYLATVWVPTYNITRFMSLTQIALKTKEALNQYFPFLGDLSNTYLDMADIRLICN